MQGILSKIWTCIRPFLAVVFGLVLISKFNLFDFIKIVPDDNKYEVCLTLYVGLFEIIIRYCENLFSSNFSLIQCVFSSDKKNFDMSNTPMIMLSSDDTSFASIYCQIKITGKVDFFKKAKIILCFPDWVDVGISGGSKVAEILENRSCIIELSNFINQNQKTSIDSTQLIKFSFLKAIEDSEGQYFIDSKLENKFSLHMYLFKANKFEIRG